MTIITPMICAIFILDIATFNLLCHNKICFITVDKDKFMNLKTLSIVVLATSTLLTACSKETYTVNYLKANPEVLAKVLDDCKANKQSNENCQNANQAKDHLDTERKKEQRGFK